MTEIKGDRLHVNLGASQTRRRLQGHGFGAKKIHATGRNQAVVIHDSAASGGVSRPTRSL
jgi:hypothetical protein